ncbi:hypothetical protein EDD18DRAFT_31630 [Armillaria luteobubalina]|uniref:Secreted protein n=1 Tax=Armillaria luteobubalina TaxID=153913 RepID=A0AA39QR77_9AGAR|nr:hypothetical protein EDD18DRAFT_31630 [Armillaria luteobubalina]
MKLTSWHLFPLFSLVVSSRLRRRDDSNEYATACRSCRYRQRFVHCPCRYGMFRSHLAPAPELSVSPSQRVPQRNISHLGLQQAPAILPSRAQVVRRVMAFSRTHILSLSHLFSQIG